MAHFVKLIGSLQLDGTGLVPLNFSLDYATKTLAAIANRVQYIITALPSCLLCLPCKLQINDRLSVKVQLPINEYVPVLSYHDFQLLLERFNLDQTNECQLCARCVTPTFVQYSSIFKIRLLTIH